MVSIRPIAPALAVKARDELHEVEDRLNEDVATFRSWIEKQAHLNSRTDDQFLVSFLRGAKHSLEKAKQKLDYYYTIRSISPEFFVGKTIDDKVLKLARLGHYVPLPKPLKPDGPRLHITRYDNVDPNEFNLTETLKYQLRIFDIQIQEDDNAIIGGTVIIIDLSRMSLRFLLQFDPSLVKKMTVFSDKALPVRMKGIHLINIPKEAAAVINLTRGLMSKKLSERMIVHSSYDTLYDHIPKEYLPEEYGGTNGRIQESADDWVQRLRNHKQFFEDDKQYGVDEKLRVGKPLTSEILFGLEGTFRKLQVD